MTAVTRSDRFGLIVQIVIALAAVLATDGLIEVFNPREMSASRSSALTPPGYFVGLVWTGLFVCMAVARWKLLQAQQKTFFSERPILILAFACLLYPLYTGGLRNVVAGLIGNVLTLILSLWAVCDTARRSRSAALWIFPVSAWLVYATLALMQQVHS